MLLRNRINLLSYVISLSRKDIAMQSCFKYVMFLYMMSIAPLRANTDRITAISLKVGETHISEIAQVSDIVVGDEGTVVVELFDESTLIIKAIRPGHTELLVKYVN